jgi:hypothetical protein
MNKRKEKKWLKFTPLGKASWKEVSEDLHSLRSLISLHQGRFRDAGRNDTAQDLERLHPPPNLRTSCCRRTFFGAARTPRDKDRDERFVLQFLRLKLKQPVTTVESHHVELVKKECFGLFDPLINGLG